MIDMQKIVEPLLAEIGQLPEESSSVNSSQSNTLNYMVEPSAQ